MKWVSRCSGVLSLVLLVSLVFCLPLIGDVDRDGQHTDLDRIKSEMASRTVSYEFVNAPFRDVIDRIRQQVSFNIIVDSSVFRERDVASGDERAVFSDDPAADEFGTPFDRTNRGFGPDRSGGFGGGDGSNGDVDVDHRVTIQLDDVPLNRAFELILERKDLTAIYRHGMVHIVPEDHARNFEVRMYDVRDLQYELTDFPAELGRFHTGYSGSSGYGETSESGYTMGSSIFDMEQGPTNEEVITNKERFMELVRNYVGPRTAWDDRASMQMMNGILVVHQTPDLHRQIDFLIHRLRRFK